MYIELAPHLLDLVRVEKKCLRFVLDHLYCGFRCDPEGQRVLLRNFVQPAFEASACEFLFRLFTLVPGVLAVAIGATLLEEDFIEALPAGFKAADAALEAADAAVAVVDADAAGINTTTKKGRVKPPLLLLRR